MFEKKGRTVSANVRTGEAVHEAVEIDSVDAMEEEEGAAGSAAETATAISEITTLRTDSPESVYVNRDGT